MTLEIDGRFAEQFGFVVKQPYPPVAQVAKQTAHMARFMTMIYDKTLMRAPSGDLFPQGIFADGAQAMLRFRHFLVVTKLEPVQKPKTPLAAAFQLSRRILATVVPASLVYALLALGKPPPSVSPFSPSIKVFDGPAFSALRASLANRFNVAAEQVQRLVSRIGFSHDADLPEDRLWLEPAGVVSARPARLILLNSTSSGQLRPPRLRPGKMPRILSRGMSNGLRMTT